MAVTRANVEEAIVKRAGPWMAKGNMAVTFAGANADLNDPIREALMLMGFTLIDPLIVTDADIAAIDPAADLLQLLDRAELRTYKTVRGRFAKPNIRVDIIEIWNRELHQQLDRMIKDMEAAIDDQWGPGELSTSTAQGSIYVETAEILDCWSD